METGISGKQELGVQLLRLSMVVLCLGGVDGWLGFSIFACLPHGKPKKSTHTHTHTHAICSAAVLSVLLLLHDGEMTLQ